MRSPWRMAPSCSGRTGLRRTLSRWISAGPRWGPARQQLEAHPGRLDTDGAETFWRVDGPCARPLAATRWRITRPRQPRKTISIKTSLRAWRAQSSSVLGKRDLPIDEKRWQRIKTGVLHPIRRIGALSRGNLAGPRQIEPVVNSNLVYTPALGQTHRYDANRSDIGQDRRAVHQIRHPAKSRRLHGRRPPHLEPDRKAAPHSGHRPLRIVLLVERKGRWTWATWDA
jgi:hypothetical protein